MTPQGTALRLVLSIHADPSLTFPVTHPPRATVPQEKGVLATAAAATPQFPFAC